MAYKTVRRVTSGSVAASTPPARTGRRHQSGTIGASGIAAEAKILADYVGELGGHADSTLLGFGTQAPASWAALDRGPL